MKRFLIISLVVLSALAIYLMVRRSTPSEEKMHVKEITIDSTKITGPVVLIFDKKSRRTYWLKSYASLDASNFDSLQGRTVQVEYMKVLFGPLEDRIFKMRVDDVVVFDQVQEK